MAPAPPTVGNDVVDLSHVPGRAWPRRARFVERILAPAERRALDDAADPDLALWRCWAAKEAAFKVVSKLRGRPPVFEHRAFVAGPEAVAYGEAAYPLHAVAREGALHAVVCAGADPGTVETGMERLAPVTEEGRASLPRLLERFTPREANAIHSVASARVRLAARGAAARALEVDEARLEVVCLPGATGRRPPRLFLDGTPAPADLSLSHHGSWLAWALLLHP